MYFNCEIESLPWSNFNFVQVAGNEQCICCQVIMMLHLPWAQNPKQKNSVIYKSLPFTKLTPSLKKVTIRFVFVLFKRYISLNTKILELLYFFISPWKELLYDDFSTTKTKTKVQFLLKNGRWPILHVQETISPLKLVRGILPLNSPSGFDLLENASPELIWVQYVRHYIFSPKIWISNCCTFLIQIGTSQLKM